MSMTANVCTDNGQHEPAQDMRDFESVPLKDDIGAYLGRKVLAHMSDAWVDHAKTKVGYEIAFTRHLYVYQAPRPLGVIRGEIEALEREIQGLLRTVLK